MYECRHFFEDGCEQLTTLLAVVPELFVDTLSITFSALEHIESPPNTDKLLNENTVEVTVSSQNISVLGTEDDYWVDGLSAVDGMRQFCRDQRCCYYTRGPFVGTSSVNAHLRISVGLLHRLYTLVNLQRAVGCPTTGGRC